MRKLTPYGAAILLAILATVLRAVLSLVLGDQLPLITYWVAVEFTAYYCGFRAAVLGVVASLVLGRFFFMVPRYSLSWPPERDLLLAGLFAVFGTGLGFLMGLLRDARRKAEESERIARERLQSLKDEAEARRNERHWAEVVLASIGDAVIAGDNSGRITFMNRAAEELTGCKGTEAVNHSVDRVFRIEKQGSLVLLQTADGQTIPIEHNRSAIGDGDDQTLGTLLVFRDITNTRRAETALVESETRLHGILEAARAAAWEWDLQTGEVLCSQDFHTLAGIEKETSFPTIRKWMEAVHPDHRERVLEELTQASHQRGEFRVEYPVLTNGEPRWLGVLGRVEKNGREQPEGKAPRIIGIAVDITERRNLEQKLRDAAKMESLGVLAGGIAHDFNNLLTAILGNANLLHAELPPGSAAADFTANVIRASERAAALTHQMLAYSGHGQFVMETANLPDLVREAIVSLAGSIPEGIEIEMDLTRERARVKVDLTQLRQLVANLIANAAEAIGIEGGTIEIRVARAYLGLSQLRRNVSGEELPEGEYAMLSVHDTGQGMDEQTMSKIFDPFYSTKFTGRGLGLAAVLGIVRGHRAALKVDSAPGEGTLFEVFFPEVKEP